MISVKLAQTTLAKNWLEHIKYVAMTYPCVTQDFWKVLIDKKISGDYW